jgi:CheY-like chemotaxis protein
MSTMQSRTMLPRTMLLVEDDPLLRECLAEMLGDAGWQVAEAVNAVKALDWMAANGMPDALVTDLRLGPGMDGLALIAEARRRWPRLRAVLTSGGDAARLDMHPADRFLGKPFGMGALIQVVMELAMDPASAGCCTALQP